MMQIYKATEFLRFINKEVYHIWDIKRDPRVSKVNIVGLSLDRCFSSGFTSQEGFKFSDFGKTWFTNKEEAVRACNAIRRKLNLEEKTIENAGYVTMEILK